MIPARRVPRIDPQHAPSEAFDVCLPSGIKHPCCLTSMNRPVNLDYEPGLDDRKIHEIAADRMLPPDREAEWSQLAQSVPRHLFGRIRFTPQTPGVVNVRVAGQSAAFPTRAVPPLSLGRGAGVRGNPTFGVETISCNQ